MTISIFRVVKTSTFAFFNAREPFSLYWSNWIHRLIMVNIKRPNEHNWELNFMEMLLMRTCLLLHCCSCFLLKHNCDKSILEYQDFNWDDFLWRGPKFCFCFLRWNETELSRCWEAEGSRFKSRCGRHLADVLVVRGGARTPSQHHRGALEQGTKPPNPPIGCDDHPGLYPTFTHKQLRHHPGGHRRGLKVYFSFSWLLQVANKHHYCLSHQQQVKTALICHHQQ